MGNWIVNHDWAEVFSASTAQKKSNYFANYTVRKVGCILPEKSVQITSEDQVWITPE
jgi:hypothetical protein